MIKRLAALLLVAGLLAGCDLGQSDSATPFPTVPPPGAEPGRSSQGDVIASGVVVSMSDAQLGFTIPGRVAAVHAALRDSRREGLFVVLGAHRVEMAAQHERRPLAPAL